MTQEDKNKLMDKIAKGEMSMKEAEYILDEAERSSVPPGVSLPAPIITRMILHEGHPDAFYDKWRDLWMENDASLRKRVKAGL